MAFDNKYFVRMRGEDAALIKKLKKHRRELKYAKNRVDEHSRIRNKIIKLLEEKPRNQKEETNLMERLSGVGKERETYLQQTRFLIFADYVKEIEKVQIFFPPPPPKKKRPKPAP